jgi:anti-anti-sigma factor
MQCSFETDGGALIACLSGRLDNTTSSAFKTTLHGKLDEVKPGRLVIDMADVEYVSSVGFRELFLAGRRMTRSGGTLAVCRFQPQVRELFELAQFMTAYRLCDTREEALAA